MDDQERQALASWLRTGERVASPRLGEIGFKFNPWHDPANGRFTFAGTGRSYGQRGNSPFGGGSGGGGGASGSWTAQAPRPRPRRQPGRTGTGIEAPAPAWSRTPRPAGSGVGPVVLGQAIAPSTASNRFAVRNGYGFEIDTQDRTRNMSGMLTMENAPRSRSEQAKAGGVDRWTTDEGGHYIARRFNGPADAFDHFAQDRNFNRGRYRAIEDEWARERRAGRNVFIKIVPQFDGASSRPTALNIWWTIDGVETHSQKIPNERSGTHRER